MKIKIEKSTPSGIVCAPPSKSMAHRLLICAALAKGESTVCGVSDCDDVKATLDCLTSLGVPYEVDGDNVTVHGIDMRNAVPRRELDCRESGSTLRFFIPICLACGKSTVMRGAPSLMRRPMDVYSSLAEEGKYDFAQDGNGIFLKGPLRAGNYKVAGGVSSQFISGLLFALPLAESDSTINIIPPVVSRPYINMTVSALAEFGVSVEWRDDHTLFVRGGQSYRPCRATVEGDYSGAAFFAALQRLGGDIEIRGLRKDSLQADKAYEMYFDMLDRGIPTVHIGDCPDLGPVLFALAAAKYGGVFTGTSRLKIKESDRAAAMAEELAKFGVSVSVGDDSVSVLPLELHPPAEPLSGHGDHRIVMSLAVLLTFVGGEIDGAEAVSKSYPSFFESLASLGVKMSRVG